MAIDALGAGLDLANNLLELVKPTVNQEQKESLLNAFKKRMSDIQAAGDALAANPSSRPLQLGLAALSRELLNSAGFTAPGLAGINVDVPLDDLLQFLAVCDTLTLLTEQTAVKS